MVNGGNASIKCSIPPVSRKSSYDKANLEIRGLTRHATEHAGAEERRAGRKQNMGTGMIGFVAEWPILIRANRYR